MVSPGIWPGRSIPISARDKLIVGRVKDGGKVTRSTRSISAGISTIGVATVVSGAVTTDEVGVAGKHVGGVTDVAEIEVAGSIDGSERSVTAEHAVGASDIAKVKIRNV